MACKSLNMNFITSNRHDLKSEVFRSELRHKTYTERYHAFKNNN